MHLIEIWAGYKYDRVNKIIVCIIFLCHFATLGFSSSNSFLGDTTNCEPGFYQTIGTEGTLVSYSYDGIELGFNVITVFGFQVNATAYNIIDGYLYTIAAGNKHLIRFSTDGTWTDLGPTGLAGGIFVGAFDTSGNYYVCGAGAANVYRIDVNTLNVETLPISTAQKFGAADWAYIESTNKFYGVSGDDLYIFDPIDNSVIRVALGGLGGENTNFGATFSNLNSALYVSNNSSGSIYYIDITTFQATFVLDGPASGNNDGASCPCSLPPFPAIEPIEDEVCISSGQAFSILENDLASFGSIDNYSFEIVIPVSNGNLLFDESNGSVIYNSDDPTIEDYFVYQICLDLDQEICGQALVRFLPSVLIEIEENICVGQELEYEGNMYAEEGIYEFNHLTENGCDSTIFLDLSINPVYEEIINERICEGEDFMYDGLVYNESGLYDIAYQTENGCDSFLTLDIKVEPIYEELRFESICQDEEFILSDGTSYSEEGEYPITYSTLEGCDSVVILHLEVRTKYENNIDQFICPGESFEMGDSIYTQTGNYVNHFVASNNCDSIITLDLVVGVEFNEGIVEEICEGESVTFGGEEIAVEGIYQDFQMGTNSCDSITTLELIVLEKFEDNIEASICEGESYPLGDASYSEAGYYEEVFEAKNGCDSLVTLQLNVAPIYLVNLTESICSGETYYIDNTPFSETGEYEIFIQGQNGCDSTIYLDLVKHEPTSTERVVTICQGEVVNEGGQEYSETGLYPHNYLTSYGCDSILVLNLRVDPIFELYFDEELCEGEALTVGSETFSETGFYTVELIANNGCDSIVSFDLVQNKNQEIFLFEEICQEESYETGSNSYNDTGVYTESYRTLKGCDSTVILDLQVNQLYEIFEVVELCAGESYEFSGQLFDATGVFELPFQTIAGCDSIMVLDLVVKEDFENNIDEVICFGSSYSVGESTYTETGNYTNRFMASNGCDSIVNLALRVEEVFSLEINTGICRDDTYEVGGEVFSSEGIYEVLIQASNGCDSLITLNLGIWEHDLVEIQKTICEGELFLFGEQSYGLEGEYELDLLTENGCDSLVVLDLQVNPVFEEDNIQEICEGAIYTIGESSYSSTGIYEDVFQTQNGCDSLVTTILEVLENTTEFVELYSCDENLIGEETLILENANGCDSIVIISTVLLSEDDCFVVATVEGMSIPCAEQVGTIAIELTTGTPPFSISWSGPVAGMMTQNALGVFLIDNLPAGSYAIQIEDSNAHAISFTTEIIGLEAPQLFVDLPLSFSGYSLPCFGDQTGAAEIMATGGQEPYTYIWSNGETSSYIDGLTAGTYSVTLIDANDCTDNFEVEITQPAPLEIDLETFDLLCSGPESGMVEVLAYGGAAPYIYTLEGADTQEENLFLNLSEGSYSAMIMDANGCTSQDTFTLSLPPAIAVELGEDLTINLGEVVNLAALVNNPSSIDSISWSTNTSSSCEQCLNQQVSPELTTTYTIYVLDENGCDAIDEVVIYVESNQDIYIPNVFSPNDDGINDVFMIYADLDYPPHVTSMHIYDRWGNEVFEQLDFLTNEIQFGWDGDYRGEELNSGVFVWYAQIEFLDGKTVLFEGNVTLMR